MRRQAVSFVAAQRGSSMLFALIALVVLMLGGAALVRSVDSGQLAMGNLGFKQDAMSAGAPGADTAIAWLQNQLVSSAALNDNGAPGTGYYANSLDQLDVTGTNTANATRALVDWDGDSCGGAANCIAIPHPPTTDARTGNQTAYLIMRLCAATGDASTVDCARPAKAAGGNSMDRGAPTQGHGRFTSGTSGPYYRVITRTKGARDTVSFTETLVHF